MNKVSVILKTLIAGYVITVAALLLLSFCLYKFRVSDSIISVGIYVTYGLSALCGGLLLAKSVNKGMSSDIAQMVKSAALCILCGAVGGVIS